MNLTKQEIIGTGVPAELIETAFQAVEQASVDARNRGTRRNLRKVLVNTVDDPEHWLEDPFFGPLAYELKQIREKATRSPPKPMVWGIEQIKRETIEALEKFAQCPRTVAAAMMPDAHGSGGMPVGGVIALDDAVCPGAVGLDIACRMKLSILDLPVPESLVWDDDCFDRALLDGSCFGFNEKHARRPQHDVMDADWSITKITKRRKQKAWSQLGSSGSGNHFVEFGLLTVPRKLENVDAGSYVALLTHSGSRGTGAEVAKWYTKLAVEQSRNRGDKTATEQTAFLDMRTEAGQEYWAAMNLMGSYAEANHDVIHQKISRFTGGEILHEIENHHNFAWLESHQGQDVYVHRKGATPAHQGQMGVIPGSMASPAHVVIGKGNPESLCSASHGAGRTMDRGMAKARLNKDRLQRDLKTQGVRLVQGSVDESPAVYKPIDQVMQSQVDLVESLATFHPKVVRMAGERQNSR